MIPFVMKSYFELPANCLWIQILEQVSSKSKVFWRNFSSAKKIFLIGKSEAIHAGRNQ